MPPALRRKKQFYALNIIMERTFKMIIGVPKEAKNG